MTNAVRGALATLSLIAALLAGGEVIARRLQPLPTPLPQRLEPVDLESGAFCARPDAVALWRAAVRTNDGGETLDALGLRPQTGDDASGDAIRILILGDSDAFGLGLPAALTYAARLQAFFDRAFGTDAFRVRNGAVPGFTIAQAQRWFETRLSDWRPDVVVVAFGNGSELEPAFDQRCDLELLDAARRRDAASPVRAFDAIRGAFRDDEDAPRFAPSRARVNGTQFLETMATLVGVVRGAGGEPFLLTPTVPVGRVGQTARDASLELYRECVLRVAATSGTGFVDASAELAADPGAFCVLSSRLTARGHARVASKLAFALLQDPAVAERVRRGAGSLLDSFATARAIAFAALCQIAHDGAVNVNAAALRAPFEEGVMSARGTAGFELLRAIVERPLDAASDARFDALVAQDAPLPLHEFAALRALLAGNGDKAAALLARAPRDAPLHGFVSAIGRYPTSATDAAAMLHAVIEASPGNGLPMLFAAKAALGSGEPQRAAAYAHAGFDAIEHDGHDGIDAKDLVPPRDDSEAAAADFLAHDSVLFGGERREAFLRLCYWSWVCEPLLRGDGHALLRLALRLRAAGIAADADAAMAAAVAWAGADPERNAALGFDLMKHDELGAAASAIDRSLAAQEATETRYLRALIALAGQDFAAALDHLDHAIATDPADGRLHLARGRCLLKLGRTKDAVAAFERTLEIWPGSAEVIALRDQARANAP